MSNTGRISTARALLHRPLVRRLLASTGSNAYAQATSIAMQLLSLPLFLAHWDVATYGQWLVLSALPAYLAMADAGMLSAAGNRMTMLIGAGKQQQANRAFQSALVFVLAVSTAALLLVLLAVLLWPTVGDGTPQARWVVLVLAAGVVASLLGGLPEAVYKATQRYALGAALANTTRLLEWLGGLAGLWWGGDFLSVALGGLTMRLLCTLAMSAHAAATTPTFHWGFADASLSEIRGCAAPAISFMAFPAANAFNFQGMTLLVAAVLGPTATVVFNTYRTLARVTVQATAVFSLALWPEFSRIYGQGRIEVLSALYRRSWRLGMVLATAASLLVYLVAPWVLHAWSGGRITFQPELMLVAMVYAAAAGAWHVSRVLLLSTNRHIGLAWPFLVASVLALPLAWWLARAFGLVGVMFAMLALELAMVALCSLLSRRLLAPGTTHGTAGATA